jgi:hypothetical protein
LRRQAIRGNDILMNETRELEKIARLLEPDAISRQQLLNHVIEYAREYLEARSVER